MFYRTFGLIYIFLNRWSYCISVGQDRRTDGFRDVWSPVYTLFCVDVQLTQNTVYTEHQHRTMYILDINTEHCIYCTLTQNTVYTEHQHRTMYILETRLPENHRSVGPDRQKCSRTNDLKIYISDRMSGKTYDI
jgi:hypothetical protein